MNELLFFVHVLSVGLMVISSQKFGKVGLTLIFCFQVLLANLFILKQMKCFGLTITCTDTFIIGCDFALGLLQRIFGEKSAKEATYLCFGLMLFFIILSQLHLLYYPASTDHYHLIYQSLFKLTPRIVISSLIVSFCSQKLNIFLQKKVSERTSRLTFLLFGPIFISQLFDTIAFTFCGLYGEVDHLLDIIVMSYLIKVITIFSMSVFSKLSIKFDPELKT